MSSVQYRYNSLYGSAEKKDGKVLKVPLSLFGHERLRGCVKDRKPNHIVSVKVDVFVDLFIHVSSGSRHVNYFGEFLIKPAGFYEKMKRIVKC